VGVGWGVIGARGLWVRMMTLSRSPYPHPHPHPHSHSHPHPHPDPHPQSLFHLPFTALMVYKAFFDKKSE